VKGRGGVTGADRGARTAREETRGGQGEDGTGGVGEVICRDGVGGPSEEDMGGKRETPGDRLITDWATAAWRVHDNRAQARPAKGGTGKPGGETKQL
jgi:hypothetical protein